MFVPVVDKDNKPLMPTIPSRARRWIRERKATPFFKKGVFCVRLNVEPSDRKLQPIAVGIDPGSKKEGFTVKSEAHTYLNIQADAVTWVKDAVKVRRNMRRARRFRNCPYRQNKINRSRGSLPPSTKARWQWKLRICNWLSKLFYIVRFIVEDIKARTKGQKRWDASFSPLEVGKTWFYEQLGKLATVETRQGFETKELRDLQGLQKSKDKLSNNFNAHCVDSWVLANDYVGGHVKPDNEELSLISPLRFHRRQLHVRQFAIGGIRKLYGGTRSLGFKRGSIVNHPKFGLTYVGGSSKGKISLYSLLNGLRLTQQAKESDTKFLSYNSFRLNSVHPPPHLKVRVSCAETV